MCILKIQQMKIFDFSQSRNDFYQTTPCWLPEYDCVYNVYTMCKVPPAAKYVGPLLINTLLYSKILGLLYRFDGVLLVILVSNIFQNQNFSSLLTNE